MSVGHKGRKKNYFISKLHLEYLTPELIPLLSNSWKQKWPNYAQPPAHFSVNSDESHMQIWPVFIRWKAYVNSSLCLSCWSNPGQSKPLPQTQDSSSFMISLVSFLSVSVQKGLNLRQGRAKSLIYHEKTTLTWEVRLFTSCKRWDLAADVQNRNKKNKCSHYVVMCKFSGTLKAKNNAMTLVWTPLNIKQWSFKIPVMVR